MATPERLERLKSHHSRSADREFYAIQRLDLLIVTIAGAGLYVLFEAIKFMHTNNLPADRCLLLASGVFNCGAIISNLLSQLTGFHCNRYEAAEAQLLFCKENGEQFKQDHLEAYQKASDKYSNWTRVLNDASIGAVLGGVALLGGFCLSCL